MAHNVNKRSLASCIESRTQVFKATIRSLHPTASVISVDEIGFDQRTVPLYGYSKKGTKAFVTTHPTNRMRQPTNVLMAIDSSGKTYYESYDHSVGGKQFA